LHQKVKRAAGYIRVSTVEQSLKGLSIETQIAEIKAYAEYHGMRLEEIYVDRGITARKSLEKRLDFMRMMRDVEAGKIDHIIVLRLDRFFRNVYDYHKMMNEYLNPNNCDWSAVKEQYTTTTTNGRLMINLRLAIAEQECDTDSDRIKDVLSHRASQGFAVTGSLPIGLKIVDHRVVPDEETKHIVKALFDKMQLTSSLRKSMLEVNEEYGTRLAYGVASNMIRNPIYCGIYRDNQKYCEPIITKEQFDKVQHLLKMNVRTGKRKHTYIFSGLIVCDHCNNRMPGNHTVVSSGEYDYYRCNKAKFNLCDNSLQVNELTLEKYMVDNVKGFLEEHLTKVKNMAQKKRPLIKSNRKKIENKLSRLNELYVDGIIDREKYKQDYADLQSQIIDEPEEEKIDLTAAQNFLSIDLKSVYETLSKVEKRALWRSIIKEIRIFNKEVVGVNFL